MEKVRCISIGGWMGERLSANLEGWLLPAPLANPGMSERFTAGEQQPRPKLMPWYGEFAGKHITAAAAAYACGEDARLVQSVDQLIERIAAAQGADGSLSPHPAHETLDGRMLSDGEEPGAFLWELWGYYHMIYGLLAWYDLTGNPQAMAVLRKAADFISEKINACAFSLDTANENFGLVHGLLLLYRRFGEEKYRLAARRVAEQAEKNGHFTQGAIEENKNYWQLPWPRWEGLHYIQGLALRGQIEDDPQALQAFWQYVHGIRAADRHNTGGFSSGEKACGDPYSPEAIETCCTVAWMALLTDAWRLSGESCWCDELELSLYNAALGAQHPSGRWWTYNTPMDGVRRASAHDIVFQALEGSPELNCCSVNGPRMLGMQAEWGMHVRQQALEINYYGASCWQTQLPSAGQVTVQVRGEYPVKPEIRIALCPEYPAEIPVRLRIPAWSAHTKVTIGQKVYYPEAGAYFETACRFTGTEEIVIEFDFSLHMWEGQQTYAGKCSLYRGPLLLACDRRLNSFELADMPLVDPEALEAVECGQLWLAPRIMLKDRENGVVLCDFASAGAVGSPYASWLKVKHAVRISPWQPKDEQ